MTAPRAAAGPIPRGTGSERGAGIGGWLVAGALAAAVIVAGYAHTLAYPFHFDDFDWIRDNPALRPPLDLRAIWDSARRASSPTSRSRSTGCAPGARPRDSARPTC